MSNKHSLRYFNDLSPEEQDTAVMAMFEAISQDYESGKIEILSVQGYDEESLELAKWDIGAAIAEQATYIPDDGSLVVRL